MIVNFLSQVFIYILFIFFNASSALSTKQKPSIKEFQEGKDLEKVLKRLFSLIFFILIKILFGYIVLLIVLITIIFYFIFIFIKYKK